MKIIYSPRYHIDIGLHVFPTQKYQLVHDRLLAMAAASARPLDIVEPRAALWEDLALVHTSEYLEKLRSGALSREEEAQLELPWSEEMVEGFRIMTGGTIEAARIALEDASEDQSHRVAVDRRPERLGRNVARHLNPAIVCHIGGGLHHAFPNHGEGFCPFNDVAVAVRALQRDAGVERAAIVDLDVHHGNGTAFIFESDPRIFTFSMHQQHNYPMFKPRSVLDIGLADGTHDAAYLEQLGHALPRVLAHQPQVVFYLAGADPYEHDQLGGLRLTKHGLRLRDRMVIHSIRDAAVPLVIVLAGGYARHVDDTVAIHCATVEEALDAIT